MLKGERRVGSEKLGFLVESDDVDPVAEILKEATESEPRGGGAAREGGDGHGVDGVRGVESEGVGIGALGAFLRGHLH